MANIHGLGSASKKADNKKEEEFSGGGAVSSTAVLRPSEGGGNRGISPADLVAQARQQRDSGAAGEADGDVGTITIYENGFIIGQGEFRDKADPQNAKFLKEIAAQNLPHELRQEVAKQYPNAKNVRISLIDKSSEVFVPPKPAFSFAKSKGKSLGGGDDVLLSFLEATPRLYVVNDASPKTTVQVVTPKRERLRVEINEAATVMQLFEHVAKLTNLTPDQFALYSGFPPKQLQDPDVTISDAQLRGASIEQRMIQL